MAPTETVGRNAATHRGGPAWRASAARPALLRWLMTCASIGAAIALWWLGSLFVNRVLLPSPGSVADTAVRMISSGEFWEHLAATLGRVAGGFLGGSALGIGLGLLMGRMTVVKNLADPLVQFFRALPPIAIIPLVIIWFGLGETSKYIVVGYGAFFIVLVNTIDGVARTPSIRERAARSLGATERQLFLTIVLPSAMPYVLTGMRVAIGVAFMSVVAAEMIAADSGIGFLILQSRLMIQTERIFVGLVVLGTLGFLADRLFSVLVSKAAGKYVAHLQEGH